MDLASAARMRNRIVVDQRYIFLVRASTRLWLVDNCEMTLDEAFDDLVETLSCPCSREIRAVGAGLSASAPPPK